MTDSRWTISEPDAQTIFTQHARPLDALAAGQVPALVLRGAFDPEACQTLVRHLIERQLLYDPSEPVPEKFVKAAIPEGYFREGRHTAGKAWKSKTTTGRRRIDIGTSLGYRGSDPTDFFTHSRETHSLFDDLFNQATGNPIQVLYDGLQSLSRTKRVVTAYEPDGRTYGPAIIRAHYGGYTYAPHFDSVRLREKREGYAVHEFEHQFAGVMVLQNTQLGPDSAQCILHNYLWRPEVDEHLKHRTFHEFARRNGIASVQVVLRPGDLYFFNTRCIHEVPGVAGPLPRVVVATFIGYSSDRDEIFVWS